MQIEERKTQTPSKEREGKDHRQKRRCKGLQPQNSTGFRGKVEFQHIFCVTMLSIAEGKISNR